MTAAHTLATAADLLSLEVEGRFEILAGEIVEKAGPSGEHSDAQSAVLARLHPPFHRRSGPPGQPGGWWILVEVDIELSPHDVIRPDISGWRRERVPEPPRGFPVKERPDWVCEVLSPSTARRDLSEKRRLLYQHGVPWYWTLDTVAKLVQVLRWTAEGYVIEVIAGPGERLGLPPFEALPLDPGLFFGIEPEED